MRLYILFSLWIVLPFVISAAIAFAPLWVSAPTTILLVMYWFGVMVKLGKDRE